jgi:hypothetical protein
MATRSRPGCRPCRRTGRSPSKPTDPSPTRPTPGTPATTASSTSPRTAAAETPRRRRPPDEVLVGLGHPGQARAERRGCLPRPPHPLRVRHPDKNVTLVRGAARRVEAKGGRPGGATGTTALSRPLEQPVETRLELARHKARSPSSLSLCGGAACRPTLPPRHPGVQQLSHRRAPVSRYRPSATSARTLPCICSASPRP